MDFYTESKMLLEKSGFLLENGQLNSPEMANQRTTIWPIKQVPTVIDIYTIIYTIIYYQRHTKLEKIRENNVCAHC